MKKQKTRRWIALFLAFLLGMQNSVFILETVFANGTNSNLTSTFNLEWTGVEDGTYVTYSQDKSTCILRPKENTYQTNIGMPVSGTRVQLAINFSLGGNDTAQPEEIEMRLPRYIFSSRDGVPQGDINIGVSDKKESSTGFYYYVDTKNDEDLTNDEIVITNFVEINSAYVFTCTMQYFSTELANKKYVSEIQDNYIKTFNATLHTNIGGNVQTPIESNALTVEYHTSADIVSCTKDVVGQYDKWKSQWGIMPEDSKESDYFYILWKVLVESTGTQPYSLSIQDALQDLHGGEIIGYGVGDNVVDASVIKFGEEGEKLLSVNHVTPKASAYTVWNVLTKYPRTIVEPLPSTKPIFSNKVEATLLGVDGATTTKLATKSYTYKDTSFTVPEGENLFSKYSPVKGVSGYLDKIDSVADGEVAQKTTRTGYDWEIRTEVQQYNLTLQEGGDPLDETHYGKRNYEVETIDDVVMLEGERLGDGDYQFTSLYMDLFEYDYALNPNTEKWEQKSNTNYEEWEPVTLYYKTEQLGEWKTFLTLHRDETGLYYITDEKHNISQTSLVQLPENTIGIKTNHLTKNYRSNFRLRLSVELKKSERVKRIREGKETLRLYNGSTYAIYDSAHNLVNKQKDVQLNLEQPEQYLIDELKKEDEQRFGTGVYSNHAVDYLDLTGYVYDSAIGKKVDGITNDTANGRVKLRYNVHMAHSIATGVESVASLKEKGALREEREGIFYDLLPNGVTVDPTSIKGVSRCSPEAPKFNPIMEKLAKANVSVELKDNWNNTGRTMMIVSIKIPEKKNNYYETTDKLYTGWHLYYDAYCSWEALVDYGNEILNSVAYQSPSGELPHGYPDNGGAISEKDLLVDLDNDGNPEGTLNNTLYAETRDVVSLVTAADLSFSKMVKSTNDIGYKKATTVSGGSEYTYRLRLASQKHIETGNIILYDELEKFDPTNGNRWMGTLKGINTNSPKTKGIDVKVYYSTKQSPMLDVNKFRDITNTEIWTDQEPKDLSTVTALAFDLRKKVDGSDYVMLPEEALSVEITMEAPLNKVQQYEASKAQAYNSCWYSGYTKEQVSQVVTDRWLESSSTSVDIVAPHIQIIKSATPVSGTEQNPTIVKNGDTIVYDLAVVNQEKLIGFENVEIEDTITDVLEIDIPSLKYYVGNDATLAAPIENSKEIEVKNIDNKLTFVIKKLKPQSTVHILIPTVIKEVIGDAPVLNVASITKLDEKTYVSESNTTYHEVKEMINVIFDKEWIDANNQDGKRPETITVTLYEKNPVTGELVKVGEKVVTGEDVNNPDYQYKFENVPKYKDGKEIQYVIGQNPIDEYTTTISETPIKEENGDLKFHIINKHDPELINVIFDKEWIDANNQDGKRPETITVTLYEKDPVTGELVKVGEKEVTGEDVNNPDYQYKFENVPKYKDGKEIQYVLGQNPIDEYTTTIPETPTKEANGDLKFHIVNKHDSELINVIFDKEWIDSNNKDGKRPETITVTLYEKDPVTGELVKVGEKEVTGEDVNNPDYQYKFENVPKYKDGKEIQYVLGQNPIDEYITTIPETPTKEENGDLKFHIVNGYASEKINVIFDKEWIDSNNKDGKRPETITVTLYEKDPVTGELVKVGEKVVTGEDVNNPDYQYKFENVPKYKDGKEIQYVLGQNPIDEYTTTIPEIPTKEANGDLKFHIVNKHDSELINVIFDKAWIDANNKDGKRPETITVTLYEKDPVTGELVKVGEKEVTGEDVNNPDYQYRFENVPKYKDGKEIQYVLGQNPIDEYTTTIPEVPTKEANGDLKFHIINEYKPVVGVPSIPSVPSTPAETPSSSTESKPEEPKKENPKKEEPEKENSQKENPKKEEPKKENPKKENPKKENPKKEEPKKENSKKENPKKVTSGTNTIEQPKNLSYNTSSKDQSKLELEEKNKNSFDIGAQILSNKAEENKNNNGQLYSQLGSPKTGDRSDYYIMVATLSVLYIALFRVRKRRK